MPAPQRLLFAPFLLDLRDERLWQELKAIRLGSKAFAVLRYLVTHAGQLVTKDTLLQTVWPETAVHEAVLTVMASALTTMALGKPTSQSWKPWHASVGDRMPTNL